MRKQIFLAAALVLVTASAAGFMNFGQQSGEAAIIQLDGTISPSSSSFQSDSITPGKVRELTSRAEEADAIVFEWNSGGGAVVASKEVKRVIKDVEAPTVCRFRDVAASGAYLSSLGCDRIVADSASVTGSIGVKSSYLELSGLLEKLGVEYVNVTAGKDKEQGSQFVNATEEDVKAMKNMTDRIHRQFLNTVREERNLSEASMSEVETGKVMLGVKAEEIGLVDRLGGRETAVETAENLTGKQLSTYRVETTSGFNFLSLLTSSVSVENMLGRDSILKASLF